MRQRVSISLQPEDKAKLVAIANANFEGNLSGVVQAMLRISPVAPKKRRGPYKRRTAKQ